MMRVGTQFQAPISNTAASHTAVADVESSSPASTPVMTAAWRHEIENLPANLGSHSWGSGPLLGDTIDLKLLVLAADECEPALVAITELLDRIGVPYDVIIATRKVVTDRQLWSGYRAHYQGVILASGNLGYWNPHNACWESALEADDWESLWRFEARFGVRQVTLSTLPGGRPDNYGLIVEDTLDNGGEPEMVHLTYAGRRVFWYLNPTNPVGIESECIYLAQPLDAETTPLLRTSGGQCVGAIRRYADGRENLALTMAHGPHLSHTLLLGYGLVNWVTRGLFLGQRQVYLSTQVDDIFNSNWLWDPFKESVGKDNVFRLSGEDVQAAVGWLDRIQLTERNAAHLTLALGYNGAPVTNAQEGDSLILALMHHQKRFQWINHGYTHLLLNDASYEESGAEIRHNHQIALKLGLHNYDQDSMVTASVSGLENPEFLRAARDNGIRYLVSDTSLKGWDNPAPNVGITSTVEAEILIVPRHPSNILHDVSTPEELTSEYNHTYRDVWLKDLSYEEILANEADAILGYLLRFDIDPLMFHQANLRAYDGVNSLLSDLLDRVLSKYNAMFGDVPVISLSLHEIGEMMALRSTYDSATVEANLVLGSGLTLSADRDVSVPVTGAQLTSDSAFYAGQVTSVVALTASDIHWAPMSALVGYEPAISMDTGARSA